MDKVWVCLMVSRSLPHDDEKSILREMKLIFGHDFHGHKVVCNDNMSSSGEYYIFAHCSNYWGHIDGLNRSRVVTGVIPSKESPHHFSNKEIDEFLASAGHKEVKLGSFDNGDVVLVKDGYLKGLYGIVTKVLKNKKVEVFFSFYVRQFSESLGVTSLEFIGKVSGYEFPAGSVDKPIVIGAHVVHHRKLCRESGRKHKVR